MNTIVNITGLTLRCLEAGDGNVIKKAKKKEYFKKVNKQWYENNKERKLKTIKQWYENNKESFKKYSKEWRKKNKKHTNEYIKNKRKNNLSYKLRVNLSRRILLALKGNNKSANTMKLLGVSNIEQLWIHLEKSFKPAMTRKNHGKIWHIDHIRPCSSFDLSKSEEQAKCFHYSNLQALFVHENLSKGSKIVA